MVRFGQWEEILKEPEPSPDQVFGRAMHHFGRGFAFSALKQPSQADAELTSLRKLAADRSLSEMKILDLNSLAGLAQIALAMLEGEIHQASGRQPQAIANFRRAVQMEDGLLYSEPPDWMLPPRQYLASSLLSSGQAKEAEEVFRQDLNRHRGNGWSLYGLEQSLRKQGKAREADEVRGQFQQAWARADVQLKGSRF
jgi:tetratricopeptide (TPR) repeat protein